MPINWTQVQISQPPRGPGTQAALQLYLKSITLTTSWGAQPATANMEFVNEAGVYNPVAAGSQMRITSAYGHLFYGVCRSDAPKLGSSGKVRSLAFEDFRHYFDWDDVFGYFNQAEKRLVGGRRVKRYRHLLPANFDQGLKTYTMTPYNAAQVIEFILRAATVGSPWWNGDHLPLFLPEQLARPVFDIDCSQGKKLGSVLVEISERQGLLFTLASTDVNPYQLAWVRKGLGGGEVTFPERSENRRYGVALSGNPTRVRVLGGRNRYQVLNIGMVKDWNAAWEVFYDLGLFEDEIFRSFSTISPGAEGVPIGTRYNAIPGDVEEQRGRQLAAARAKEITVREFATLEATLMGRATPLFLDARMFAGRSRNDMPAALYINQILFRAFKPGNVVIGGQTRPLHSLDIIGEMAANVTHNPSAATNPMTYDLNEIPAGNGYAVIRGYNVGADLFATIKPEKFNLDDWLLPQNIWQAVPFQIDESGEDGHYILFDEPVINSGNLIKLVDGHAVFNAAAIITTPQVLAALMFEAERFSYYKGSNSSSRDHTENVAELHGEYLLNNGGQAIESVFEDGLAAITKADGIANELLAGQFSFVQGGYDRPLVPGDGATSLSGIIDRVTFSQSPTGIMESVDFTTERASRAFQAERDFDRRLKEKSLLPGEAELRTLARQQRLVASALKGSSKVRKTITEAFRGIPASSEPLVPLQIENGTGTLPVGTPLYKKPIERVPNAKWNRNTVAVMPSESADEHTIFAGVVTRDAENAGRPLSVQRTGVALVRVKGPVEVNDELVKKNGQDYLVSREEGGEDAMAVGVCRQATDLSNDEEIQLREVSLGAGTGGSSTGGEARWA